MFMAYRMLVSFTQGRIRGVACSEFRDTDFREFSKMGISRMEDFELGQRIEVNTKRGNNVDG